jgi:hypothetical protein
MRAEGWGFVLHVCAATVVASLRCTSGPAKTCGGQQFYRPQSLVRVEVASQLSSCCTATWWLGVAAPPLEVSKFPFG